MSQIDEKTNVRLWGVLAALPVLAGGMVWLTTIDSKASEAKDELKGMREMLIDVRERVIRIEEHQKKEK